MGTRPATTTITLPSLFVSHGAPDLALSRHPAREFLEKLGRQLPAPRAILVISAHWQAHQLSLTASKSPETIHDFAGFQNELYDIRYPARTSDWLIERVMDLVSVAGHSVYPHGKRGYDHGAWTPLRLMYPDAGLPVVQLSLVSGKNAQFHFDLGRLLTPLRRQGVLILASGAVTHNLRFIMPEGSNPPDWAVAFDTWLERQVRLGNFQSILNYENEAPDTYLVHPTPEHFIPIFVALGAGSDAGVGHRVHHSYSYGSLAMDAYVFGEKASCENLAGANG